MTGSLTGSLLNEVGGLRWYLPVRSPADQAHKSRMANLTDDAASRLLRDTPLDFPRIARIFRVDHGYHDAPDAAVDTGAGPDEGVLSLDGQGAVRLDLGGDVALLLDGARDAIVLEQGGILTPLWGEERPDILAAASATGRVDFQLGDAHLSFLAETASDHANALVIRHVLFSQEGQHVALHAQDPS